jgi:DNA-binding HxlR family transcriptional regulator
MPSTGPSSILLALSGQRWLAPLLADLAAQDGARFAVLLHRLNLPRDSLVRALAAAQQLGWVMHNPGHGHPLRPEYLLTATGRDAAVRAAQIVTAQAQLGIAPGATTRWGLPLVAAIQGGHDRFNALARYLVPATPRALSQALVALGNQQLVARDIVDLRPPTSRYALTARGAVLATACSS